MSRIAVYPGSFDPITTGHVDIIERISKLFEQVIVLVSQSNEKNYLFTGEERAQFIQQQLVNIKNVKVIVHNGLTVDYMKAHGAQVIVRGLRAVSDFEHEGTLSSMNKMLAPEIETFMIFSRPELYFISSRGVKEVAKNNGHLVGLVPDHVIPALKMKYKKA